MWVLSTCFTNISQRVAHCCDCTFHRYFSRFFCPRCLERTRRAPGESIETATNYASYDEGTLPPGATEAEREAQRDLLLIMEAHEEEVKRLVERQQRREKELTARLEDVERELTQLKRDKAAAKGRESEGRGAVKPETSGEQPRAVPRQPRGMGSPGALAASPRTSTGGGASGRLGASALRHT
mmetsp:Transcript_3051/g.7880  ORF Transcript_3051/g.7880 Transcript_3051/m.7880 type:complete len:183 (+) Transcript_3051:208-756(+)